MPASASERRTTTSVTWLQCGSGSNQKSQPEPHLTAFPTEMASSVFLRHSLAADKRLHLPSNSVCPPQSKSSTTQAAGSADSTWLKITVDAALCHT